MKVNSIEIDDQIKVAVIRQNVGPRHPTSENLNKFWAIDTQFSTTKVLRQAHDIQENASPHAKDRNNGCAYCTQ